MSKKKPSLSAIVYFFVFLFEFTHAASFATVYESCIPKSTKTENPQKITVIGTGYVGLVLGVGLAEFGNTVICTDIDQQKITLLKTGVSPIYEPGLSELILENISENRLFFSSDIPKAIRESDVIFIAVSTPAKENGEADLRAIEAAAKTIGENLDRFKIVCNKSTVPIGVGKRLQAIISNHSKHDFLYVSNPEFLREGTALLDFFEPERMIFGCNTSNNYNVLNSVFQPLHDKHIPFVYTNLESAEAIKYASNSFLAVKISFINEFSRLCESTGADIDEVARGMGMDSRIGSKFLNPGPGYGGSCFPKDTQAILQTAKEHHLTLKVISAAAEANDDQKEYVFNKLKDLLNGTLKGKTIAVLGLAFKANTDDVRDSAALTIIKRIIEEGGNVRAFDPIAISNTKKYFPNITYADTSYAALDGVDGVIVLTEWEEFRSLDLIKVCALMKTPVLVDTRNLYDPHELTNLGFTFDNIGKRK